MHEIFPLNVKEMKVRGLLKIIKDNGTMKISELARESNENIDELLPLIDACELLGLCAIDNGKIMITTKGKSITFKDFHKIIEREIRSIEPFKAIIRMLGQESSLSTEELVEKLDERGIIPYRDETKRMQMREIKEVLLNWAIKNSILEHDHQKDTWRIKQA